MKMQYVYWEVDIGFYILRNWVCYRSDRYLRLQARREHQEGLAG